MFISYAQNFEDVVLSRALGDVARGTYVDVGAFEAVRDSVTWTFYRRGWSGALVEPVPSLADALREQRPRDVTIAAAAGAARRSAQLYTALPTGNSTLLDSYGAELAGTLVTAEEILVPVAPLDDLLAEAGFEGRTIHFCSIDVEGSEADVLAGFDLERWRPWILVVEATKPNTTEPEHEAWEPRVLASGYRFTLFDGLNRFYVDKRQAGRLGHLLSYPACVFDQPFERVEHAERRRGLKRQLSAMEDTFSWRVTRPLRAVRGLQLARSRRAEAGGSGAEHVQPKPGDRTRERALPAVALAAALDPPLTIIDVGVRGGIEGAWAALSPHLRVYGFDPDPNECRRLADRYGSLAITFVPLALGESAGSALLHLTADPACSSLYPPDTATAERYPALGVVNPARTTTVTLESLDNWAERERVTDVSYLELDSQGSELGVLRGGTRLLESVCALGVEVEFSPIYRGQPLFGEVDAFLRDHGFVLWRLTNLCHYTTGGSRPSSRRFDDRHVFASAEEVMSVDIAGGAGRLFWGEALYVRRGLAEGVRPADPGSAARAACVLLVLGLDELAAPCL